MKELSIEEKAKRYDEAIKVLHKYDGANIMFSQSLKEEMFPELAENEDDMIRKEITEFFKNYSKNGTWKSIPNVTKWIAWLEKQKSLVDEYEDKLDKCACDNFNKGYKVALEKQSEQKPIEWSERDSYVYNQILNRLANKELYEHDCEYIYSLLKSLRPQKQNITNKDFEDVIREIKTCIAQCNGFNRKHREEVFNLLDSLRPQNTWKPSEEQMIALDSAIHCYSGISPTNNREVYALEIMKEQLKKLREE